jgi:hypothetical protein
MSKDLTAKQIAALENAYKRLDQKLWEVDSLALKQLKNMLQEDGTALTLEETRSHVEKYANKQKRIFDRTAGLINKDPHLR